MLTEETRINLGLPFKKDAFKAGGHVGYRVRKPRDKRDLLVGTVLKDRYFVLSIIGKGGMSLVYKAKDLSTGKVVAVKALRTQGLGDETIVKRFKQEAEVLHRLNHPRIVSVYDYGTSRIGQPYFIMDYLVGVSLSQVLRKQGPLNLGRFQDIFVQIAAAVSHAHKHKAIHRDLKPGNIMLVEMGDTADYVKIVDFGIAKLAEDASKLTRLGEVWGSPIYMSPEQGMGTKIDTRTDIYSLGIVMYEALTGDVPFLGKNYVETMTKQMSEAPAPFSEVAGHLNIPASLEMIVFKALQKSPDDRYQTMADLKADLEKALSPDQVADSPTALAPQELELDRSKKVWSFIREKIGSDLGSDEEITESQTREAPKVASRPGRQSPRNPNPNPDSKRIQEDFITTFNRPQVVAASIPDKLLAPSEYVQRQSQKLKPLPKQSLGQSPDSASISISASVSASQSMPAPTILEPANQHPRKPLNSLVQSNQTEQPEKQSPPEKRSELEETIPASDGLRSPRERVGALSESQSITAENRVRKRPRSAKKRTTTTKMKTRMNASQASPGAKKKESIKPFVITCVVLVALAIGYGIVMSEAGRTLILNLIYQQEEPQNNESSQYPY
ncbi:protein kinase [bacterium]|nr:protein kinase [bacterium]